MVRLHVNVDHVATLRQARGTSYPSPIEAARLCEEAGAHGITVHLREDRRHIQDADVVALRTSVKTILNLEMAATEAMVDIAVRVKPDLVTLVPEKREERTTEGGLDVAGDLARMTATVTRLAAAGIPTSMFVNPSEAQLEASRASGAKLVELHTGDYAFGAHAAEQLRALADASRVAKGLGLRVAAGHGLTRENVRTLLAAAPEIEELNVGHALVCDAVFVGIAQAVRDFLQAMAR